MSDNAKVPDDQDVVDEAVQKIIDRDEAGVGTAMRVFEKTERQYHRAAAEAAPPPQVVSRSGTGSF